jgi:hypothetical protein
MENEALQLFRRGLSELDVEWRDLLPGESRPGFALLYEAWNPGRTMRVEAGAYEAESDEVVGTPFSITVAFYDDLGEHMHDAAFGLSHFREALTYLRDVSHEALAIDVYERDGSWNGSASVDSVVARTRVPWYSRSRLRTYDARVTPNRP